VVGPRARFSERSLTYEADSAPMRTTPDPAPRGGGRARGARTDASRKDRGRAVEGRNLARGRTWKQRADQSSPREHRASSTGNGRRGNGPDDGARP